MRVNEVRDLAPCECESLRAGVAQLRDEFRRRAQIHDEGTEPVSGDFRRDDVEIAQNLGALLEDEQIVARLDDLLAPPDSHRDPGRARAAHTARSKRNALDFQSQRDEAQAEVERLRERLGDALAALMRARPWVGCVPIAEDARGACETAQDMADAILDETEASDA